jgi:hypothetical protein
MPAVVGPVARASSQQGTEEAMAGLTLSLGQAWATVCDTISKPKPSNIYIICFNSTGFKKKKKGTHRTQKLELQLALNVFSSLCYTLL